jgi:hypothetical protein
VGQGQSVTFVTGASISALITAIEE